MAATVAESETSIASAHHRTSTRKRSPAANQGKRSLPSPQRKGATKRKRDSSLENDLSRKKMVKKKHRKECYADGSQILLKKEEYALGMVQRRRSTDTSALLMDAHIGP